MINYLYEVLSQCSREIGLEVSQGPLKRKEGRRRSRVEKEPAKGVQWRDGEIVVDMRGGEMSSGEAVRYGEVGGNRLPLALCSIHSGWTQQRKRRTRDG